jgi:hypothetical protein
MIPAVSANAAALEAAQADEQTVLPTATEKSALADLFQLEC